MTPTTVQALGQTRIAELHDQARRDALVRAARQARHGLVPVRLLADRNRQQVGGSTGLAVLGTVAWTVIANSVRRVDLTGAQQPAAP